MPKLDIDSNIKNIEIIEKYVFSYLDEFSVGIKCKSEIAIIIDEVLSNIIKHGDNFKNIKINVNYTIENNKIILVFIDNSKMFNPLTVKTPNIKIDSKKRKEGGLGIYITKNLSDKIEYEYIDYKNILKIIKNIE